MTITHPLKPEHLCTVLEIFRYWKSTELLYWHEYKAGGETPMKHVLEQSLVWLCNLFCISSACSLTTRCLLARLLSRQALHMKLLVTWDLGQSCLTATCLLQALPLPLATRHQPLGSRKGSTVCPELKHSLWEQRLALLQSSSCKNKQINVCTFYWKITGFRLINTNQVDFAQHWLTILSAGLLGKG